MRGMFALRIVKSAAVSIALVVLIATSLLAAPAHRGPGEFVTDLGNRGRLQLPYLLGARGAALMQS